MNQDPIVEEVHKIREKMLQECGGDIDRLMDWLQQREASETAPLLSHEDFRTWVKSKSA